MLSIDRELFFKPSIQYHLDELVFKFNSSSGNTIFLNLPERLNGHSLSKIMELKAYQCALKSVLQSIRSI